MIGGFRPPGYNSRSAVRSGFYKSDGLWRSVRLQLLADLLEVVAMALRRALATAGQCQVPEDQELGDTLAASRILASRARESAAIASLLRPAATCSAPTSHSLVPT